MARLTVTADGFPRRDSFPGWQLALDEPAGTARASYALPVLFTVARTVPVEPIAGLAVTFSVRLATNLTTTALVLRGVTDATGMARAALPVSPPRGLFTGLVGGTAFIDRVSNTTQVSVSLRASFGPERADGSDGTTTGTTGDGVRLSWFQAEAEAFGGVRIRRAGWTTKYLEHQTGTWILQFFSAATGALGIRRVPLASDFLSTDFAALDWTYDGIAGQSPAAGTFSGAVDPTLRFP